MKIRVVVYLRPKTVAILLSKKKITTEGMRGQGYKWFAEQLGISQAYVSRMVNGKEPVPATREKIIWEIFRGMSHKPGGRLTDGDLFQRVVYENGTLLST